MYSIVDVETTGGSPKTSKITEIAIFRYDGQEICDEFSTLVNPEQPIPPFITQLTGISDEMVAGAPKFYEIARKIVEFTEDTILVGHNVQFDYGFIKNEFESLDYPYRRETLCTVRLSRKMIPGKRSYSLGNLCQDLGIVVTDRHRASGDALATVKLFKLLIEINGQKIEPEYSQIIHFIKAHNSNFNPDLVTRLPNKTGVYYFYNEKHEVIYVGHGKNIYRRVFLHFKASNKARAIEMKNAIADISYEVTGSELIAMILEFTEVEKLQPFYNKSNTRKRKKSQDSINSTNPGNNYFLIDQGRNDTEYSVVKIEEGRCAGYGFLDIENMGLPELRSDCIKPFEVNLNLESKIQTYLKKHQVKQIIKF